MCSPIIVVALIVVIATGNAAFLIPAVVCVVMMGVIMGVMLGSMPGGKRDKKN